MQLSSGRGRSQRTGVVELSRLANGQSTATNDKDLLDVGQFLGFNDPAVKIEFRVRSGLGSRRLPGDSSEGALLGKLGSGREGAGAAGCKRSCGGDGGRGAVSEVPS